MELPKALAGPYGGLHAAMMVVVAWRAVATAGAVARQGVLESAVMSVLAIAVAGLALLPIYAAVMLRARMRWTSGAAHATGFAATLALHAGLWWVERGAILGDTGYHDRFMALVVAFAGAAALMNHGHHLQAEGRLRLRRGRIAAAGALAAAAGIAAATLLPAAAHTPVFLDAPGTMEAPFRVPAGGSWAILQRLGPGQAAVFERPVEAGGTLRAGIVLLATRGAEGFRPGLAVLAPGLPPAPAPGELPVKIPEGWGAVVPTAWGDRGHEDFTEVPVLWGPKVEVPAVNATAFRVVVWAPPGQAGDVWVALGLEERFRWQDLHLFPAAWLEIRSRFWA